MKNWFIREDSDEKRIPEKLKTNKKIFEGQWAKCPSCEEMIHKDELKENLYVCPKCDFHFRLNNKQRIETLLDDKSFREFNANLYSSNPLDFSDIKGSYLDKVKNSNKKTGLNEAFVSGSGKINGIKVGFGVLDFFFLGGSMASVVGEKITRLIEKSIKMKMPVIIVSASGGARMHEGIFSLMQMAKTSAALSLLSEAHLPFISVVTDPTTGGVTASFAMLGDVIIAEPKSLIGFAGPRVIEQTIKQKLPKGFQRSEFALEHGLIDMVVHRKELKDTIYKLLKAFLANRK